MSRLTQICFILLITAVSITGAARVQAATFLEATSTPFGTFNGVEYLRYTGRFQGVTSLGAYDVPFEIVAPADLSEGNGSVLFEPPHWFFPPVGRDFYIGRDLIFGRGISYASVGFGTDAFNILDPAVPAPVIAGSVIEDPGILKFAGTSDEEILIQFAEALRHDPVPLQILRSVKRVYAYGVSRSADILVETQLAITGTESADIFDLTFLHNPSWEVTFPVPGLPGGNFDLTGGEYTPPEDVGRVMILLAEGDLLAFDAEQFEQAINVPGYRVYEVSGAAHLPTIDNPLDHGAVLRSIFVAGDQWARYGIEPPVSVLIDAAPEGEIDPVYGVETGIARNFDGNALGGIRLPNHKVGLAWYVASDPATSTLGIPFLGPLTGSNVSLACVPRAGAAGDQPRFGDHGQYVSAFVHQANALVSQGYLLPKDAESMKEAAAESDIGNPMTCR